MMSMVVMGVMLQVVQPTLSSMTYGGHVAVPQTAEQVHRWVGHALARVAGLLVAGAQDLLRLNPLQDSIQVT